MQMSKRNMYLIAAGLLGLITVYVAFYFIFLDLIVDYWWFSSMNYQGYFWLRLLYQYLIPAGVTLFFFAIFFLHFWIASFFIGNAQVSENDEKKQPKKISTALKNKFQTGALEIYIPLSLIMALIIAMPFYHHWEKALLFFFGPETGIDEMFFGHDIGFYMFSFPIYQLIQKQLLSIAVVLLAAIALLYWLKQRVLEGEEHPFAKGVDIHLAVLAFFVVFFVIWGMLLDRFSLLYYDNSEPVFYGPGFIEIHYLLPLIWLSIISFLLVTAAYAYVLYSKGKKGHKRLLITSAVFFLVLLLRYVDFIPNLINTLIVQPNPVKSQKPFMQKNINATLHAYGLDKVNTEEFVPTLAPLDDLLNWEGKKHLDNVPLWDRELLKDVYFQLQGLRPYYSFPSVDEDRYEINDILKQVNLSAREINTTRLPQEAQNWENIHLRYTHGYGAVMTPAAQAGGQPQSWFLRDLDLYSPVDFQVQHPDIYYGLENYSYAIVPNKLKIAGIAGGQIGDVTQHSGQGGIPVRSLFRKLLFAFYFKEEKIFFSINISDNSRLRFRRNIIERIEYLAPYLKFDSDPYLVVAENNFYWIQDAYTTSDWYPVSKRSIANLRSHGKNRDISFNYIRNSVKVVVNAYDGATHFYITDPEDPILQAYQSAYPGFFKPIESLPAKLSKHLRYPRDMFYYQMRIYNRYHQIEPELFYQQAETWEFPVLENKELKPYFLTTELQGCADIDRFIQLSLMTPINRDNLSAFAAAGTLNPEQCDSAYSPSITLFKIRKDIQLDGPMQMSALIDQDPVISEQMTLWDQHGSTVVRGRIILLPVGNTVLYLQPLYLISTETQIPELARVIVATGSEAIMKKSASSAFKSLEVKLGADPEVVYPKPPQTEARPQITVPKVIAKTPEPPIEEVVEAEKVEPPAVEVVEPVVKEPLIKFVLAGDISFAFGKAEISPAAAQKLTEIADKIKAYENIIVFINGYSDNKGSEAYNLRLSTQRAEAVRKWLIRNQGIAPDILISKGYGEQNPIAANSLEDGSDNPVGRAKNRRVEISVERSPEKNQ